jgi:sporulation protein YtfJ
MEGSKKMNEHPINGLMNTALNSIKDMVDVNTIVGDPVQSPDGSVIIPISKVSFGLAAGGGEYGGNVDFAESTESKENNGKYITPVKYPFAGGSGAGVSICPVAFLIVGTGSVQLLPVDNNNVVDKLVDMVPDLINKINGFVQKKTDKDMAENS